MENEEEVLNEDLVVVGIGASAGGLEALQGFIKNIKADVNMSFVVAQHLSPTYKSLMVSLLSKDSSIEILEAQNLETLKANKIYICPPNKHIVIESGKIVLLEPKNPSYGPKPSIDMLFESLAQYAKNKSIGVILSGTGTDGSRGVRAIKAEGGFTIAQQPTNAKYDGMPNSAINTGNIDLILDCEIIVDELQELLTYPNKARLVSNVTETSSIYKSILLKLKKVKEVDFSLYKTTTIQRRIERRMTALRFSNISDYNSFLDKDKKEVENLYKDILIGVTSFFRDYEPFEVLKEHLSELIKEKTNKNIRIWIPGCSTGEEAYTIAIIICEILKEKVNQYKVQIFATDIDEEATSIARKGLYPESALTEIDKNLLKKYFIIKNDNFEVIKPVRDMCIFSKHDITADPAFMRLDLISCRNLLIYFTSELQKRIFPNFHYALNDNGILLLGKSESIGIFMNYFKPIDTKWKIYEAIYLGQKNAPPSIKPFKPKSYEPHNDDKFTTFKQPTVSELIIEHIERNILPSCIVVNESFNMIYIKGKNPYLSYPEGEITQNIFKSVSPEISIELRSALHQVKKAGGISKTKYILPKNPNNDLYVRIIVSPLDSAILGDLFLIVFEEEESEYISSYDLSINNESDEINKLTLELEKTREHLQTVIEELETSNEEMQSLNEELQSSNEELQSSNEELETTNEELQSTNEELQTAYSELQSVYVERDQSNKELLGMKSEYESKLNRFEALILSSELGVYEYDIVNNTYLYIDEKFCEILGYKKDEILNLADENILEWFEEQIHKDFKKSRKKKFEELLLGKIDDFKLQYLIKNKKGDFIEIESICTSIKEGKSRINTVVGCIRVLNDK